MRLGATWWRDAWELWVQPYWGSTEALRLRIDPATMTVTDARVVHGGAPPGDEPGTTSIPGATPDEILAPPGAEIQTSAPVIVEPTTARPGDTVTLTANVDVCDGLVVVYELEGGVTKERGVLVSDTTGAVTWHTAPEGSRMTIPPCEPISQPAPVTYQLPELTPGSYLICLTRESDACAEFKAVELG